VPKMCDLGICAESFNPRILFVIKRKFDIKSENAYHLHDFISLIYILSGSCSYNVNNVIYQVKKGDLLICNTGTFHGRVLSEDEEVEEFHTGLNNIFIKGLPKDYLISEQSSPLVSFKKYGAEFCDCCNEMLQQREKDEPGYELIIKSLSIKMITLILKETYFSDVKSDNNSFSFEAYDKTSIVSTILKFINENYENNISLDKISQNMYLSSVYISKIFKDETGDSPINYLIKVRLSKAKEMLENGSRSVKSIAENVGYHDVYHFSKLFKKYYGCAPSKYKV
jgi:AraC-like DNA-binding protein